MSYSTYLQNNTRNGFCPFCEEQSSAIDENETAFVLPARAPYTQDHLLICTKTHKQYLSDLTAQELQDIQELMLKWSKIIKNKHGEFVIFLRQGVPGGVIGQSLSHLHRHIVQNFPIQFGGSQEMSDKRKFLNDEEYQALLESTKKLQS